MISFYEIDKKTNADYVKLLIAVSRLSGLFSDSKIPLINYRAVENIFCRCFCAQNLSRSDIAFDAKYLKYGVGLKTFVCEGNSKSEKIAEFNSLASELRTLSGKKLAIKLSKLRNDRIGLAKGNYKIKNSLYHLVARKEKKLVFFETDYDIIDVENIKSVKIKDASLFFDDSNHEYSYNYSKSTLYRRFIIPENCYVVGAEILVDPFKAINNLLEITKTDEELKSQVLGRDFVIIPLYGITNNKKVVFEKSGLNQWNAGGRKRDSGEIYIPISQNLHKEYPHFFPSRDQHFNLQIPSGETYKAKLCQDNAKALMTDPNKAMSKWLLRDVLKLNEGELLTYDRLKNLGIDSVIITKIDPENYSIDIINSNSIR